MFTLQAQALYALLEAGRGSIPEEFTELLVGVLTQCNQPLEHRGPVTFTDDVTFENGVDGALQYGKAIANWVNAGANESYVMCQRCGTRSGGELTGEQVRVALLRQSSLTGVSGLDPNVRTGAVIGMSKDKSGEWVAITGYLDDKIGTLKWWKGTEAEIPPGWRICTEIGGTGLAVGDYGRFLMPYVEGSTGAGTLGQAEGSLTHTHDDHIISAHVVNPATSTGTIGSGGGGSGFTGYNPETTVLFTTDCAETGITIPDHSEHSHRITSVSTAVNNFGTESGTAECIDECVSTPTLACGPIDHKSHIIIEPGCTGIDSCGNESGSGSGGSGGSGGGGGHQHTGCVLIPMHRHDFTIANHTHSLTMNPHTHTVENHDDLQHFETQHLNPYVTTYLIERFE